MDSYVNTEVIYYPDCDTSLSKSEASQNGHFHEKIKTDIFDFSK